MSQAAPLVDRFGRVARDLRVSLTDRCNLRCSYCMPAEGLEWLPTSETLSDSEVIRLILIAVEKLGIRSVRFTGGEPLLRKGLTSIASAVHEKAPEVDMAITTNALGLEKKAGQLFAAGVTRANISLDSLDPQTYAQIARRDRLADALAGARGAQVAGMHPIKINTVVMRGVNDDEPATLLRYCLENGFHLRFIEQMPLGPKHNWKRQELVSQAEIIASLEEAFELSPSSSERGTSPAQLWQVQERGGDLKGDVGIIASVSEPFCGACDRTRLTSDGQIRNCLFSLEETDLRTPLREGASDEEIADIWRQATWEKKAGHLINDAQFLSPDRTMSRIGG
ncbi:MAG: GTP 3',8-cyclase MoaA [Actinomycetaceae bacterium]|nr:GTP 3',8-cyclase MoaA [Actinomycetaceae bacterium]